MQRILLSSTLKIILLATLFGLIGVVLFLGYAQIAMNSDFASLLLEADEILHGNPFLKGWNLTGATFIFSEIPYYIVANLIFGVSTKAYLLASATMYLGMIIFGFLLLPNPRKWHHMLLYFAMTALPPVFQLQSARAHVGIFVISLAAFWCLKRLIEPQYLPSEKRTLFTSLYALLIAAGTASDSFILPIVIVPVVLYSLREILSNQNHPKKPWIRLLLVSVAAVITGILLERAFLALGGAELNSRTELTKFNSIDSLFASVLLFVKSFLKMSVADLSGTKVFSVQTVFIGLRLLVLLYGFWIVFRMIIAFFQGKKDDTLSTLLSLSIAVLTIFLLLVPFLFSEQGGRYYAHFPIAFTVLIIRRLTRTNLANHRMAGGRYSFRSLIVLTAVILIAGGIRPLKLNRIVTPQDRLATWLLEHNLTDGYADFWQANHTTVASNNRLRVSAINCLEQDGIAGAYPYYWFSKTEWYNNLRSNFVIVADDDYQDVTVDNIIRYAGSTA